MTRQLLLSLTLLGATLCACNGKSAEVDNTRLPPDRDPLAHFCKHMAQGPSAATMAFPAIQRQAAWAAEMTEAATVAKIQGWPAFQAALLEVGADEKQAWLEAGVKVHGLEAECAVILKK